MTQFWDRDHLVAKVLDQHLPANTQLHCCRRNGILWDLVALYSPAAQWENASPDFVDGPVVKAGDTLEKHLRKGTEQASF